MFRNSMFSMAASSSVCALRFFFFFSPAKQPKQLTTQSLLSFKFNKPRRTITFQPLTSSSSTQSLHAQLNPSSSLSNLPHNLVSIIQLFQSVSDPKAKYQQLLYYASKLPPMDKTQKTELNKVRGCVSQVWVHAFPDPAKNGAVRFEADSDAVITRGLAALLVEGLSGSPPDEIAAVPVEFVQMLGLRQSLTPSRNNGFLNMLKLMQKKALEVYSGEMSDFSGVSEKKDLNFGGKVGGSGNDSLIKESLESKDENLSGKADGSNGNIVNKDALGANGSMILGKDEGLEFGRDEMDGANEPAYSSGTGLGGRGERIRERLQKELTPVELVVEDVSYQHAGHAAIRGSGDGETHFNLRVVSKEFEGKSMVKRHRLIYNLLQEELQSGLHALSIDAKTPEEV